MNGVEAAQEELEALALAAVLHERQAGDLAERVLGAPARRRLELLRGDMLAGRCLGSAARVHHGERREALLGVVVDGVVGRGRGQGFLGGAG